MKWTGRFLRNSATKAWTRPNRVDFDWSEEGLTTNHAVSIRTLYGASSLILIFCIPIDYIFYYWASHVVPLAHVCQAHLTSGVYAVPNLDTHRTGRHDENRGCTVRVRTAQLHADRNVVYFTVWSEKCSYTVIAWRGLHRWRKVSRNEGNE